MKTRSKIGNKSGNPAYRTPSVFRSNKNLQIQAAKLSRKFSGNNIKKYD
jgi:hypothetical protein